MTITAFMEKNCTRLHLDYISYVSTIKDNSTLEDLVTH